MLNFELISPKEREKYLLMGVLGEVFLLTKNMGPAGPKENVKV